MLQQHQAEILAQLETLLDSVCADPLPVADRLELRLLAHTLCHASTATDEPLPNTSKVDAAVTALKRIKANLKRRNNARDGPTCKRLMEMPDDARTILLSSVAFIFRDKVDEWSQSTVGCNYHQFTDRPDRNNTR